MEIRTLRYFLAVAREENMTKAANILHVSQPTLSKQLKSLEDELGKKLFNRHSFSIELTEEGMLLKKRAEDLVSLADRIQDEFQAMDEVTGGEIFFGLAESWQIRFLARMIKDFKTRYPRMRYHITSGDTEQVTEKLDKGILDFAVLAQEPDRSRYQCMKFPEPDIWGVVMPKDASLASKKEITVDDLIGLPLFCSEQSWRYDIPRWCGNRMDELHLEGSFRLSYNGAMFALEGLGYLLTFDHLIDTSGKLVFRPLSPRLETYMYLAWRKHHAFSPIAERFLREIQEKQ